MNKLTQSKGMARTFMLMNNPQQKLLTQYAIRAFYYPDANHHHLNQEVYLHLIITDIASYSCKENHQVCRRPPPPYGPPEVGWRPHYFQD